MTKFYPPLTPRKMKRDKIEATTPSKEIHKKKKEKVTPFQRVWSLKHKTKLKILIRLDVPNDCQPFIVHMTKLYDKVKHHITDINFDKVKMAYKVWQLKQKWKNKLENKLDINYLVNMMNRFLNSHNKKFDKT